MDIRKYELIKISDIKPGENKRKKGFEGEGFESLKRSIDEKGVLQPIIVKKLNGKYRIVAGERRYRAVKELAGKNNDVRIPALEWTMSEEDAFDVMMIENLMRENLTELEEAEAFKQYLDEKGADHLGILADRIGIGPRHIRKKLAVLKLPKSVLKAWENGNLSFRHLEEFLRLGDNQKVKEVWEDIKHYGEKPSVKWLRERINSYAIELKNALFDLKTEGCLECGKNSDVQKSMFDLEVGKKRCQDPGCFRVKQEIFIQQNWDEVRKKLKVKTNGFKWRGSINWEDYESFYDQKPTKECRVCQYYVSILDGDDSVCIDEVCIGDKSCFREKTRQKSSQGAINGKESKDRMRSEKHGREFREKFYETKIPERLWTIKPWEDPRVLRLMLFSILKKDVQLRQWFAGVNELEDYWDEGLIWNRIMDLNLEQAMEYLHRVLVEMIMQNEFSPESRRLVGDHLQIDLKKEWMISEDYLKAKTKKEIHSMAEKFGFWKEKGAKDYLYETLGKKREKFDSCRKDELIKIILQSGIDLAEKVPEEIYQ